MNLRELNQRVSAARADVADALARIETDDAESVLVNVTGLAGTTAQRIISAGWQVVGSDFSDKISAGARRAISGRGGDDIITVNSSMRTPLAPNFMAVVSAFFMARRNATRRSNCKATFSAASWPSRSGLLTS